MKNQIIVYDQILFNKCSIKKAKILSHKNGVLKLPISKISTKEALLNSDRKKNAFLIEYRGLLLSLAVKITKLMIMLMFLVAFSEENKD